MVTGRLSVVYNSIEYPVNYNDSSKVGWLKQFLSDKIQLAPDEMYLVVDGVVANDAKTFLESRISPSSSVEIFKKLKERIVKVKFRGKVHEFRVCDSCFLQQIVSEVLSSDESVVDGNPSHYALTMRGAVLSNFMTVKKLHLERTDVLTMISGVHFVAPNTGPPPESTTMEVRLRENASRRSMTDSVRSSFGYRDSFDSSIVKQSLIQEVQALRDELDEMRSHLSHNNNYQDGVAPSNSSNNSTTANGNREKPSSPASSVAGDSMSTAKNRQELQLLRNKVEASGREVQESLQELRQKQKMVDDDLEMLKLTVDNLSSVIADQEGGIISSSSSSSRDNNNNNNNNNNATPATTNSPLSSSPSPVFSSLQLKQLSQKVDDLRHVVGVSITAGSTPISDQVIQVSTRMKTLQREFNDLRLVSQDVTDRLDTLEHRSFARGGSRLGDHKGNDGNDHDDNDHDDQSTTTTTTTNTNPNASLYTDILDLKGELDDTKREVDSKIQSSADTVLVEVRRVECLVQDVSKQLETMTGDSKILKGKTVQLDTRMHKAETSIEHLHALQKTVDRVEKESTTILQDVMTMKEDVKKITALATTAQKESEVAQKDANEARRSGEETMRSAAEAKTLSSELKKDMNMVKESTVRLSAEVHQVHEAMDKLQQTVKEREKGQGDKKTNVEVMNARIQQLETSIGGQEGRLKEMESKTGILEKTVETLESTMKSQSKQIEDMEGDLGDVEDKVDQASNERKTLTSDLAMMKKEVCQVTEMKEKMMVLQEGVSGLQEEVSLLQGDLKTTTDDLTSMKNEINGLHQITSLLQSDLTTAQSSITTVNSQMGDLKEVTTTLQHDLTAIHDGIDSVKGDLTAVRGDVNSTKDSTVALSALTPLETRVQEMQSQYTELEKEMHEMQSRVIEQKRMMEGMTVDLTNSQRDIDQQQNDLSEAQSSIITLQNELKGSLRLITSRMETLATQQEEWSEDIEGVKSTMNEMEQEMKAMIEATKEATKEIVKETVKETVKEVTNQVEEVQKDMEEVKQELKEGVENVSSVQVTVDQTQSRLTTIDHSITAIQTAMEETTLTIQSLNDTVESLQTSLETSTSELATSLTTTTSATSTLLGQMDQIEQEVQKLQQQLPDGLDSLQKDFSTMHVHLTSIQRAVEKVQTTAEEAMKTSLVSKEVAEATTAALAHHRKDDKEDETELSVSASALAPFETRLQGMDDELAMVKRNIEDIRKEQMMLSDDVEALHAVKKEVKTMRGELKKEMEEVKEECMREVNHAMNEMDGLKKEKDMMKAMQGDLKKEVNGVKKEVNEVKKESSGVKKEMKEMVEKVEKVEKVDMIEKEMNEMKKEERKKEVTEMKKEVERLKKDMNGLKKDEQEGRENIEEIKKDVEGLKKDSQEAKKEMRKDVDKVKMELKKEVEESKKELEKLKKETTALQRENSDTKKGFEMADRTLHTMKSEMMKELQGVNSEVLSLTQEMKTSQTTLSVIQSDLEVLREDMVPRTAVTAVQAEAKAMAGDLSELATLKHDVNGLKGEIKMTKKDIARVKENMASFRNDFDSNVTITQKELTVLHSTTSKAMQAVKETKTIAESAHALAESSITAITQTATTASADTKKMTAKFHSQLQRVQEVIHRIEEEQGLLRKSLTNEEQVMKTMVGQIKEDVQFASNQLKQAWERERMALMEDMETLRTSIQEMASSLQKVSSSSSSPSPSTITQAQLEMIESRLHDVQTIMQEHASLQVAVTTLKNTVQSLHETDSSLSIKQANISTSMATLSEDWDSRQQALLHELTFVKEQLAHLTDGCGDADSRATKRVFRRKNDEESVAAAFQTSLEVLREDEKSLKERVVLNSEACSDRFVRLSQQLETLRQMVFDQQATMGAEMKASEDRLQALMESIAQDVERLRNVQLGMAGEMKNHHNHQSNEKNEKNKQSAQSFSEEEKDDNDNDNDNDTLMTVMKRTADQPWRVDLQRAVEDWGVAIQKEVREVMESKTSAMDELHDVLMKEKEVLRGEMDSSLQSTRAETREIVNVMVESLRSVDPETVCTVESLIANCKIPECVEKVKELENRVNGLERRV